MENQKLTVRVISTDQIEVPASARNHSKKAIKNLAASINDVGLLNPIVLTEKDDGWDEEKYLLVAGAGRLAAVKLLDQNEIAAQIVKGSENKCRRIEISENIFRTGLTVLEEAKQLVEYIERKAKAAQLAPDTGEKSREGGVRKAARDLNMARDRVARAISIASIPDDVVETIKVGGLDNNQRDLLAIAKSDPDRRTALIDEMVRNRRERKLKSSKARGLRKKPCKPSRTSDPGAPAAPKELESLWNCSGSLKAAWERASLRRRLEFGRDVLSLPVTMQPKATRRSGRR